MFFQHIEPEGGRLFKQLELVKTEGPRDYSNWRRYSIKEMINTSRISVIMRTPMP